VIYLLATITLKWGKLSLKEGAGSKLLSSVFS